MIRREYLLKAGSSKVRWTHTGPGEVDTVHHIDSEHQVLTIVLEMRALVCETTHVKYEWRQHLESLYY